MPQRPSNPLEPVCTVEQRSTVKHIRPEGWGASAESRNNGDLGAEQPGQVDTRRHVPRDRMSPLTDSQRSYSESASGGTYLSSQGETPVYRLFPAEDTAQRAITASYQPSTERLQDVRVPRSHADTLLQYPEDDQSRGRDHNLDSRDRATIQDISWHREQSTKVQVVPSQSSRLSTLTRHFLELGLGRYPESARFVSENPEIIAQEEIDALVAVASIAQEAGQSTMAQTCIHQALLLRTCQKPGLRDSVEFIRNLERDYRAREAFIRDVKMVYSSIQKQARKSLPQSQTATSESHNRKEAIISQATDYTAPQDPSTPTQNLPELANAQTKVLHDRDGRLFYTDDQGRVIRPPSSRHGLDRHRSVTNTGQTTVHQHRGATSETQAAKNGKTLLEMMVIGANRDGDKRQRLKRPVKLDTGSPENLISLNLLEDLDAELIKDKDYLVGAEKSRLEVVGGAIIWLIWIGTDADGREKERKDLIYCLVVRNLAYDLIVSEQQDENLFRQLRAAKGPWLPPTSRSTAPILDRLTQREREELERKRNTVREQAKAKQDIKDKDHAEQRRRLEQREL